MKKTLFLTAMCVLAAGSALAGDVIGIPIDPKPRVPEIDVLSGLAAMAVVGGAVTLLWERRRRK